MVNHLLCEISIYVKPLSEKSCLVPSRLPLGGGKQLFRFEILCCQLVPFFHQEKVANIPVLDTVSTHVKFVKRNNIFREVVADTVIRSELTGNSLVRRQQITNLNIQLFSAPVANEINLLISCSADRYRVASAQQFEVNDIFKNLVDVPCITAIYSFADSVVCNVVFSFEERSCLPCKSCRFT